MPLGLGRDSEITCSEFENLISFRASQSNAYCYPFRTIPPSDKKQFIFYSLMHPGKLFHEFDGFK
jgi:hypothetical protein